MGAGGSFLGVKWLEHETGHSLPYNAEVKNAWSHTSTPSYVFMIWCLLKHRGNFIFTYRIYSEHLILTVQAVLCCRTQRFISVTK